MVTSDEDLEIAETLFDKSDVMALASAIKRTGDADAAMALDVAFREFPAATEWIAQARAHVSHAVGQRQLALAA